LPHPALACALLKDSSRHPQKFARPESPIGQVRFSLTCPTINFSAPRVAPGILIKIFAHCQMAAPLRFSYSRKDTEARALSGTLKAASGHGFLHEYDTRQKERAAFIERSPASPGPGERSREMPWPRWLLNKKRRPHRCRHKLITKILLFEDFLEFFGECGDDLEDVADDTVCGDFEDGGVGVFIDGDYDL